MSGTSASATGSFFLAEQDVHVEVVEGEVDRNVVGFAVWALDERHVGRCDCVLVERALRFTQVPEWSIVLEPTEEPERRVEVVVGRAGNL